jgi:hypothetical protein
MRQTALRRTELKRKTGLTIKSKRSASAKTRELDRIVSLVTRSCGKCLAAGYSWTGKVYRCSDSLECAHLKSRRHKCIRFSFDNVVSLCHTHHRMFTEHPDLWTAFIESQFPGRWEHLNALMNEPGKVDYPAFLNYWRAEAARLGVSL